MYLACRCGIHSRYVLGVFEKYESAVEACQDQANREPDDWHTYGICILEINKSYVTEHYKTVAVATRLKTKKELRWEQADDEAV